MYIIVINKTWRIQKFTREHKKQTIRLKRIQNKGRDLCFILRQLGSLFQPASSLFQDWSKLHPSMIHLPSSLQMPLALHLYDHCSYGKKTYISIDMNIHSDSVRTHETDSSSHDFKITDTILYSSGFSHYL